MIWLCDRPALKPRENASNERPRRFLTRWFKPCQFLEPFAVDDLKRSFFPTNNLCGGETLQGLVGVDKRKAKGIRNVLLRDGQHKSAAFGQADLLRPDEQMQQQIGRT